MGVWGMGLTQSDEYLDVYDQFVEEYNNGREPDVIAAGILDEYSTEFNADDGVLHDVYFAIAKAQWERGKLQSTIFERVRDIIQSGDNLRFYEELDATAPDLRKRKKNLDDFLQRISSPSEKPRKRKKPPVHTEYPLSKGDIFGYSHKDGFGGGIVLDVLGYEGYDVALIAISDLCFVSLPVKEDILNSFPFTMAWFERKQLLQKKSIVMIGAVEIIKSFNHFAGVSFTDKLIQLSNFGNQSAFMMSPEFRTRMAQYGIPRMRIKDYLLP